jgi:predicted Zn-dependent peptidase
VEGATDVRELVQREKLEVDSKLVTGQLDNGLRYVIMPNKVPPQRFEAHLEVHVGSVDELPNEQVRRLAHAADTCRALTSRAATACVCLL